MNGTIKLVAPLVAALAIAACSSGGTSNVPTAGASQTMGSASTRIPEWQAKGLARAVCPQVAHKPSCLVLQSLIVPAGCNPTSTCGFTAQDLETAYNLTPLLGNGSGTKVAVIEAGDLASAATDLSSYRTAYGLGTASFFKYNENGQQSNYPPSCQLYNWCLETALDIEMVSASCPKCTIYLMEAKDGSTIADFEQAEKEAVTLGATIVSNSWSCPNDWDCQDPNFGNFFNTKGVAYLASTGDSGYGSIGGPSALASVIGVGGTQLHKSGSTFTESIWSGASAGCSDPTTVGSPGVPKPSWQTDPDCTYRTDGDVSAQAGLSPGVAVYDSGWGSVGGTSVASPFLAGVIALEGNASSWNANGGQRFWALSDKKVKHELHYISAGSDGSCGGEYLCTAGTNQYETYSGPGGWGSPKGDKAF
ncbi:MAG: S8 family serine peptidase [Candidatus Eremiobacteraeota bacterium]|nr:S8 family serine peptidase [Candidatus Eremiobacteraeota bacterium]